jgi:cytochrome c
VHRFVLLGAALAGLPFAVAWGAPIGDAAKGQRDALICRACHQMGPNAHNAVGPVLNGVVGRKAGTYPGYDYSQANKGSGITWTVPELQKYLAGPQKVVPGTKMIFAGFPNDPQKVNDIIAYLQSLPAEP